MKILLADDHDLVRETIAAFLEKQENFEVTVAGTLGEAVKHVQDKGAFDLVLLDFSMPGMDGLAGLRKMIALNGAKPVAILSGTATRDVAEEAIRAGAAGFLPKTLASKSMISAMLLMAAGEIFAPFGFMQHAPLAETNLLTDRERDVLAGLSEGKSNKEIAIDHGLQEVTVKLHVKTLSRKLKARNRTHAAMIARDRNLI